MKNKGLNEVQFLALLQKVLPKMVSDPHLASTIYDEVAKEVRLLKGLESFEKFCEKGALPDVEPETVTGFQNELAAKFGDENVDVTPDEDGAGVAVEIALPDRTLTARVKVDPAVAAGDDEVKVPFVPFPIAQPNDPELVWILARREDLGPDEAARALEKIEEEFWATKKGQQLQGDRVEKTFAEFIAQVPAAALLESGLKRHYKEPETLKTMRLPGSGQPAELAAAEA